MENSPQEQGGEVRNTSSDAGTTVQVEEGNGDLSGRIDATASAPDNSVGARYKLRSPAQLPISRSPCILTIPPGLSPTSFLESPVLLSNIKAEHSPTTGSFSMSKMMQGSSKGAAASLAQNYSNVAAFDQIKCDRSEFQFDIGPGAATRPPLPMASSSFQLQHKDSIQDILHENFSRSLAPSSSIKCELRLPQEVYAPSMLTSSNRILDSDLSNHRGQQNSGTQASSFNNKDAMSSVANDKLSDDGYNWRKYGQKLVKGSEFPRSYYKCTYPNCETKKIFERSPDGLIKEIVYKGTHDHPKPQSNRRHAGGGAVMSRLEERVDRDPSVYYVEDNTNGNTQISYMEQASTPVLSPQQENEDGSDATLQLQCANEEIDDNDPFSKKRKLDGAIDEAFVVKPIREPRVVVQTLSEIDILDDGYRWRKYGQKVVRGNPNPRSYYKCTSAGCSVRKHVERASHDPKAVITTYEGKHNHEVPTARMSSHEQAGPPTMSGIQRTRSGENVSNSVVNHGVGMGYMQQGIEPIDNSRTWPLNLFRPTFQSIFPLE